MALYDVLQTPKMLINNCLAVYGLDKAVDTNWMILFKQRVHLLYVFSRHGFDHKQTVAGIVNFCPAPTEGIRDDGLRPRERLPVVDIVDGESFAEIAKDQRAVLFHFEMTGHVLFVEQVIIYLHFRVSFKIVRHEHDRNINMHQFFNLRDRIK